MVQRVPLLVFALGLDGLLLVAYLEIFKNVNLFVKCMWLLRRNTMTRQKLGDKQRNLVVIITMIPSAQLKMKES